MKNNKTAKTILKLAWPTMLEHLMQTIVQYVDIIMVGALGTHATAAVGATTTVNWLVFSCVSAISIGFLSYVAKALGAKDSKKAQKASAQAVFITLVAGIIFTCLTLGLSKFVPIWMQVEKDIQGLARRYFFILYLPMLFRCATTIFSTVLRAAGDSKTPMKIGAIVNAVNVILNFVFIYPTRNVKVFNHSIKLLGLGLGVEGAALASATAFIIGGILTTVALYKHPVISPKKQSILPDKTILLPCLKVALPNMLQRFATSFGYVIFASMINSLGEVSTAAHTVANTVESLFYIPGYGMQAAAATLAGNAVGEGNNEKLQKLTKQFTIIEIVLMLVSGTLLFASAPPIVSMFTQDIAVKNLGVTVLRMVAISEPFFGVAIIIEGILQGMGKTMEPFIYNVLGMWGIRILGTFICTRFLSLGLVSAWGCMIAHNLFLCIMFFVFSRGKIVKEKST